MAKRITVVTAGHLSTCPRMLKAADAFAEAGYEVRMISTRHVEWATKTDEEVRRSRTWRWTVVDYDRISARVTYLKTGLRYKAARKLAKFVSPAQLPLHVAASGYGRVHSELLAVALAEPTDLFYGGTTGALAAVAMAGRRTNTPYALDLEDFHSAEQDSNPDADLSHALAERIERDILPGAAFLTTGSAAMAAAYRDKYGVNPIPIHNTFPLPDRAPDFSRAPGEALRLYWFSQTIGPQRGLEDVIQAAGLADIAVELHLRGNPVAGYLESLQRLAADTAPGLRLIHHEPINPDAMVESCRGYDVGLALEQAHVFNRAVCLTNKAFTYMLAGLAVVFTDTPGQRPLALDLGNAALLYQPGDVAALAAGLKRWAENKELLRAAKVAAWESAKRRWHWQHAEGRGALLKAVNSRSADL
ncbi:MAG: glycosyltransferase [Acidobacteriota bacterium]|nr:glycosyltransferase [Acidobacteriota bacterium]